MQELVDFMELKPVVIVGSAFPASLQTYNRDMLADELSNRLGINEFERGTFEQIAGIYENRFGRHALIQFLKERIGSHFSFCRLGLGIDLSDLLLDMSMTSCIADALRSGNRKFTQVINEGDLLYTLDGFSNVVALRGSLDRPETLVITLDDFKKDTGRFGRMELWQYAADQAHDRGLVLIGVTREEFILLRKYLFGKFECRPEQIMLVVDTLDLADYVSAVTDTELWIDKTVVLDADGYRTLLAG